MFFIDPKLTRAEIAANRGDGQAAALLAEAVEALDRYGELAGIRQWGYRTRLARLQATGNGDATEALDQCVAALGSLRGIVGDDHTLAAISTVDCATVALLVGEPVTAMDLLGNRFAGLDDVLSDAFGPASWRVAETRALRASASPRTPVFTDSPSGRPTARRSGASSD